MGTSGAVPQQRQTNSQISPHVNHFSSKVNRRLDALSKLFRLVIASEMVHCFWMGGFDLRAMHDPPPGYPVQCAVEFLLAGDILGSERWFGSRQEFRPTCR
jgi:hypothetical protein